MKLSEQGPITQVRLLFDGQGGTEIVSINDEVVQLEAENVMLLEVIKCGATMGSIADNYLHNWLDNIEALGDRVTTSVASRDSAE